ncbi:MAG: hypothetical protein ACTSYI_08250 [Promethearchaeota archaeon]
MKNKKITISGNTWAQLKKIKQDLAKKNPNKPIQWSETLDHLIKEFKKQKQPEQPLNPKSAIKSPLPPIKLPNSPGKGKKDNLHDDSLGIPAAPPKKPLKIDIKSKDLKILARKETKDVKYILIECNKCGSKPILMPVPKKLVLEAVEPVVDISYIHGDPEHVVVAQLDHDFQVRRRRVSEIVYEKDYKK